MQWDTGKQANPDMQDVFRAFPEDANPAIRQFPFQLCFELFHCLSP
jgi:hypothetical protein